MIFDITIWDILNYWGVKPIDFILICFTVIFIIIIITFIYKLVIIKKYESNKDEGDQRETKHIESDP